MAYGIGYRMKGDKIPDQDHISRLCLPRTIAEDGQIQATAFVLRKDEEGLSVNWLEFLDCSSREDEINEVRDVYNAKMTVGAKAKIAVLNVGQVCKKVLIESLDRRKLDVLHDPEEVDPSHSGIYNLRLDDELIAELILQTVDEPYPARS